MRRLSPAAALPAYCRAELEIRPPSLSRIIPVQHARAREGDRIALSEPRHAGESRIDVEHAEPAEVFLGDRDHLQSATLLLRSVMCEQAQVSSGPRIIKSSIDG